MGETREWGKQGNGGNKGMGETREWGKQGNGGTGEWGNGGTRETAELPSLRGSEGNEGTWIREFTMCTSAMTLII